MCDFTHLYLFPAWSALSTPLSLPDSVQSRWKPVIRRQNQVQKFGQKLRFGKHTLNPSIVYSVALQAFIGLYVPWGLPVEEVAAAAAQKPTT